MNLLEFLTMLRIGRIPITPLTPPTTVCLVFLFTACLDRYV
jgi:hypothetical protein